MIEFIVAVIVVLFLFPLKRVSGNSMSPTLKDGDLLITRRLIFRHIKEGDIVVFKSPTGRQVVKRLCYTTNSAETGAKVCWMLGDNSSASHDSRHYGYVSLDGISAKVIYYPRKKRCNNDSR